jgi:predicted DNA-binding transcriptional regulator YafY
MSKQKERRLSGLDFRSSSVTADILNYISDGKLHTINEIAEETEVSRSTVKRHLQSLSYRYPVETFCGGIERGGVRLDTKYIVQGKIITNEKLQILGKALELLQSSNSQEVNPKLLKEFISDFAPPTKNKEGNVNCHEN